MASNMSSTTFIPAISVAESVRHTGGHQQPELLSPAGSLKAMHMAFAYGADAVYAGQPRFSLRVRNNEFDLANLALGIEFAHAHQKKFYVVVNIAPHNAKLKNFVADLAPVLALAPDALIVSDPGVIYLLREHYPDMPLHLSVQANTMNWAAVKFWQQMGIERVILSRELGIDEIAEIKQRCPSMELEVFVHGALCMAYSGRCLISSYMNKRDPNQGACTNACRWEYKVAAAPGEPELIPTLPDIPAPSASTQGLSQRLVVQQAEHPGEQYPLEEDEHGSYLFNSRDLRAVAQVEKLIAIGVNSLKIEGRTKSPYYVGRTAQVYRQAMNAAAAGTAFDPNLLKELDGLANRGYTEGFLQRHTPQSMQNYEQGHSVGQQQVVGEVTQIRQESAEFIIINIEVKNKFMLADKLLLMTPSGNIHFTLMALTDQQDNPIQVAPGSGHKVCVHIPQALINNALASLDINTAEHWMLVKELP